MPYHAAALDLNHEFTVSVPIERAWSVLTDLETVAPCLPGAELQGQEGEAYLGRIRIKLGPIEAQYRGQVSFVEADAAARRVVLLAEGRETRGQGNVKATIQAELVEVAAGTQVCVATDLGITGRVAQMGRGLVADVSTKLMDRFVENLENGPLAGEAEPVVVGDAGVAGATAEPVDLLQLASGSTLRRLVPVLIGLAVVIGAVWYLSR